MNGNLLDTNIIIKYLAGDLYTKQLLDNVVNLTVPVIVVGELQYGARKSSRAKNNLALFERFLSNFEIIPVDEKVAVIYGDTKELLRTKGINIPENDIWIAATAKSRMYKLLTYDAHFKSIDGLEVVS